MPNMKIDFKKLLPHAVAVLTFFLLAAIYFAPMFKGYVLRQSDVKQFKGMAKEIVDYRVQNDQDPLWSNSMFGGMPAYQVSMEQKGNFLVYVDRTLKLYYFNVQGPIGLLFISMLGFYIFALCLRINPWLGIVGAIAFGFSTINVLFIEGGHMTKVNSIAYMAPALGGMLLAFRGKWLLGSAVFALFLGLNVTANHLQMTYYLLFLVGIVGVGEIIRLIIEKNWNLLTRSVGALTFAGIIGLLPTTVNLLTTMEYSEFTTRGTTDLTIKPARPTNVQEKEGLNKNYILEYNFGPRELLSLIAPAAKGEYAQQIMNDEAAMESADPTYAQQIGQMNRYWGGQSFSGGAFYFGVVMLAFFALGMVFLKDALKWPFLVLFVMCGLLASNDPGGLNDIFINKVPMYNKFRDSKMILAILQVIVPALGILFLDRFFFGRIDSTVTNQNNVKGFRRIKQESKIAGVSTGLAVYFNKDVKLVRSLLIATSFFFGLGAIVYVSMWISTKIDESENIVYSDLYGTKSFLVSGMAIVVLLLANLYYFPSLSGDFITADETKMFAEYSKNAGPDQVSMINGVKQGLIEVRQSIYQADMGRSILLVLLGLGIFIFASRSKTSNYILIGVIGLLVTYDNISVCKRYLNNEEEGGLYESYETKEEAATPVMPSVSDISILKQEVGKINGFDSKVSSLKEKMKSSIYYNDLEDEEMLGVIASFGVLNLNTDYRVLSFNNPFAETTTSYFHKSLGGYHGAKLKRYQQLVDFYVMDEMDAVNQAINLAKNDKLRYYATQFPITDSTAKAIFDTIKVTEVALPDTFRVLNMLNTRYVIADRNVDAVKNTGAYGNAWFVKKIIPAKNSDEEMLAIKKLNALEECVVQTNKFKLNKTAFKVDTNATVKMVSYGTNELRYQANSKTEMPLIFSEIYYPEGWNCYVNNKLVPQFCANYVLRGIILPSGKSDIVWKFEPKSYATGTTLASVGSILVLLLVFGAGFMTLRDSKTENVA